MLSLLDYHSTQTGPFLLRDMAYFYSGVDINEKIQKDPTFKAAIEKALYKYLGESE